MQKNWSDMASVWVDPGEQGENLRVNQFPTFHLLRLASLAKSAVTREYLEAADLSVPEWRLLATVVLLAPIPFSDITSMTTMDKGQVSRTLRSAQQKGYVSTEIVPPDRRQAQSGAPVSRVIVRPTEAGQALYDRVMPQAQQFQLGLIELMSPDERKVVADVLHRLFHHMQGAPKT